MFKIYLVLIICFMYSQLRADTIYVKHYYISEESMNTHLPSEYHRLSYAVKCKMLDGSINQSTKDCTIKKIIR